LALGQVVGGGHLRSFEKGEQMVSLLIQALTDLFFLGLGPRRIKQGLTAILILIGTGSVDFQSGTWEEDGQGCHIGLPVVISGKALP
jgi:hypothetical protein